MVGCERAIVSVRARASSHVHRRLSFPHTATLTSLVMLQMICLAKHNHFIEGSGNQVDALHMYGASANVAWLLQRSVLSDLGIVLGKCSDAADQRACTDAEVEKVCYGWSRAPCSR